MINRYGVQGCSRCRLPARPLALPATGPTSLTSARPTRARYWGSPTRSLSLPLIACLSVCLLVCLSACLSASLCRPLSVCLSNAVLRSSAVVWAGRDPSRHLRQLGRRLAASNERRRLHPSLCHCDRHQRPGLPSLRRVGTRRGDLLLEPEPGQGLKVSVRFSRRLKKCNDVFALWSCAPRPERGAAAA